MQVIPLRCAGLDVHKKTVVTTMMLTQPDGTVKKQTRTFSTMTGGLLALDTWLSELEIQVIALESTGVYWHPVFNLLEDGRTVVLVNPQHMKAVAFQEDRHQRERVAGRPPAPWTAQGELYPPCPHSRTP